MAGAQAPGGGSAAQHVERGGRGALRDHGALAEGARVLPAVPGRVRSAAARGDRAADGAAALPCRARRPREHKQAWESFNFAVEPLASLVTTAEDEVRLVVTCSDVVRRGNRFAGMTMDIDVHLGKRLMGIAHTRFNDQPAAVYRRMRGSYADIDAALENRLPAGPPVEPHRVGRNSPADVVLSPAPGRETRPVAAAGGHRPPGALRPPGRPRARDAPAGGRPAGGVRRRRGTAAVIGMRTDFVRYVELDAPAVVVAGAPGPRGHGPAPGTRLGRAARSPGLHLRGDDRLRARPTGRAT